MQRSIRGLLLVVIGLVAGLVISITGISFAQNNKAHHDEIPVQELRNFVEILNRVKDGYVEDVDDKELIENSIRGMLAGLDPHSSYLDEDAFKELSVSTDGEFGGLGIQVQMENGFVRVVSPIDDTPADKAGMQAGDIIVRIDDEPVKGMDLSEAVKHMRGKPGTKITLTVIRQGEDGPFKVEIKRAKIKVASVKSRMLTDNYGYVRITQFSNDTGDGVRKHIKDLKKSADGQLGGIVLDLRNNPGGVLQAAAAVSDAFLDEGHIVSIRGRTEDTNQQFDAHKGDVLDGKPIIVLVNAGSASASEIVAGALQDNKRAVIMGQKTFGKGSVQTVLPLTNDTAIKLTTARYYTPSGRSIQAKGIKPDVRIDHLKVTEIEDNGIAPLSEADLSGVLSNEDGDDQDLFDDDKGYQGLAKKDYALYEALNLLQALHILSDK